MEVYVDDLMVKSKEVDCHGDLQETFAAVHEYKMKLNLAKCAFDMGSAKFLGLMVSEVGLKLLQRRSRQ